VLELADKAVGAGLADSERERWRTLTEGLLTTLQNISLAGSERRKHLRVATALGVQVLAPVALRGLVTSSIGGGGLSMPMEDPPPIGTALELSIRVPQRQASILAAAKSVWRRPPPQGEMGVSFTDIQLRDRDLLEGVVIKLLVAKQFAGY